MSENYNLNNNFGLNVSSGNVDGNKIQQAAKNIDEAVINLFENITNYVAKYENVFSGETEQEINMYTRQSMMVGMSLRAEDKTKHHFDTNI